MRQLVPSRKVSGRFVSGIAVPVKFGGDGGFVLAEGDEYVRGQVLAAVYPNESDNPFNVQDVVSQAVFQNPDDPTWKRRVRQAIVARFSLLERERIARLVDVAYEQDNEAEVVLRIGYINLESTESKDVAIAVTSSGSARIL